MKRFLATTAMALALAMPAAAQTNMTADGETYLQTADEGDIRSSEFVGMRVYTSEADLDEDGEVAAADRAEWEDVGEIGDVLMTREGEVKAILVDVGGFLGIGEKTVAIDMDELSFLRTEGESEEFLVFKGSRETLEAAPEFEEREMDQAAAGSSTMSGAAATGGMAAGGATAALTPKSDAERAADQAGRAVDNAGDATANAAGDAVRSTENAMGNAGDAVEEETDELAADADRVEMKSDAGTGMMGAREGWTEADSATLTADDLEGADVYDANDESIGEVTQLILQDDGKISQAVIEVGGFLGLGAHQVAMPYENLHVMREGDGDDLRVYVDVSKAELEAMPEHDG